MSFLSDGGISAGYYLSSTNNTRIYSELCTLLAINFRANSAKKFEFSHARKIFWANWESLQNFLFSRFFCSVPFRSVLLRSLIRGAENQFISFSFLSTRVVSTSTTSKILVPINITWKNTLTPIQIVLLLTRYK